MSERSIVALIWWSTVPVTQFVAFSVVIGLDPAGLDPCGPLTTAEPRPLQRAIAGVSVVGAFALAVWWLRGWHLIAALAAVGLSALFWMWLLAPVSNCPYVS